MLNAFNPTKTTYVQPSLRPEIENHGLDHDFDRTQPILRNGEDAAKRTVMPTKPALAQGSSSSQRVTTSPSYKTVWLPPAQIRQQRAVASETTTTTLSTKPTSRYTAQTFVDAAGSGNLDAVLRHIDAGLDVNVEPKTGNGPPLIHAAAYGHEMIVRMLLEAGAFVNHVRTDGMTALMWAVVYGHTATVQVLLEHGASVDRWMPGGLTALTRATLSGHIAIVQVLLEHGATVDQATRDGWTALAQAADHGDTAIVQALLDKGAAVDKVGPDGMTALLFAARNGETATVQLLLNAGANNNIESYFGKTALSLAIRRRHKEVVKLLHAQGAHASPEDMTAIQSWFR
jgi:ankyrin repeat protein